MKIRKIFCFVSVVMLAFSIMAPTVLAAEDIESIGNVIVEPASPADLEITGNVDILHPDVMTRGNSAPTSLYNLGNGSYKGSFTSMRSHVYTNYYFTCGSSGAIKITLNTSWQEHPSYGFNPTLTVRCIRKSDGVTVSSTTYPSAAISRTMTCYGLSASQYYYFYIQLNTTSAYDSIKGSLTVSRA